MSRIATPRTNFAQKFDRVRQSHCRAETAGLQVATNQFEEKIMNLKSTTFILATAILGLTTSVALAQTAAQHNGPGGPKDKVEKFVNQYGLTLPPPPPTPPSAPVSTTTVTSPPAAPPKKK